MILLIRISFADYKSHWLQSDPNARRCFCSLLLVTYLISFDKSTCSQFGGQPALVTPNLPVTYCNLNLYTNPTNI